MHKLTIEDDEGKTVVVPLIRDEITVGRQEGNSIRLTERNISRRHARFFRQGGNLFVEDLGSYTGIKVAGARISAPTALKDGDLVVIGDYKLTIRTDRPVATKLYGGPTPFNPAEGTKPLPLASGATPLAGGRSSQVPAATAPLPVGGVAPGAAPVAHAPAPAGAVPAATVSSPALATKPAANKTLAPGAATSPANDGTLGASGTSGSAGTAGLAGTQPLPAGPAPEATLDAAPTIPVRTLAEQGLAADGPPPARLVVTATNLAGAEFALDRPSLVIGRTPENDIVLNHKSISRHHAKIIRDGDKYIVVDLESANGVRVNGAEFERVELQTGDTLELGHVRMKFTSGNEIVDFEASSSAPAKRRTLLFGAAGAVALAGIVLSLGSGSDPPPPPAVPTAAAPATTDPGPVAPGSPATPSTPPEGATAVAPTTPPGSSTPPTTELPPGPITPPPAPATPSIDVDKAVSETKTAVNRKRWDDATTKVDRLLAAVPTHAEGLVLKQTITAEKASSETITKMEEAAKARSYEDVVQLLGTIPENSVYRERAVSLKESTQKRYVAARLTEVEQFTNRGECEEARHEAGRVLAIDPDNDRAKSLPDKCDRLAAQKAEREAERAERQAKAAAAPAVVSVAPREAPAARPPAEPRPEPRAPVARAPIEQRVAPPAPRAEPRPAAPRPEPRAPAAAPPETGDADTLVQQAQQAWLDGHYAAAIESAQRALRVRPNTPLAHGIIAACSCTLKDAGNAGKAYARIVDQRMKDLAKRTCQKNGITLN